MSPGRRNAAEEKSYSEKMAGNEGDSVSDGAGTRSRAGLPPETVAMKADREELPSEAAALAADTLPVPDATTALIDVVEPWDYVRDRKLGRDKRPSGDM